MSAVEHQPFTDLLHHERPRWDIDPADEGAALPECLSHPLGKVAPISVGNTLELCVLEFDSPPGTSFR